MPLSEIGVLWLWVITIVTCTLLLAVEDVLRSIRKIGGTLWQLFLEIASLDKETVPIGTFVAECLPNLLRSGLKSASLVVRHRDTKHRLEFRKYFRETGEFGIDLIVPEDISSSDHFAEVRDFCIKNGYSFRQGPQESADAPKTIAIDCAHDVNAAVHLTETIWKRFFGLSETVPRRFTPNNVSPFGELVDHPAQKMMSTRDGWKYKQEQAGQPPNEPEGCGTVLLLIGYGLTFLTLFILTIASHGDIPDWSFQLGKLPLGGSVESLILICLYPAIVVHSRRIYRRSVSKPAGIRPSWLAAIMPWWRWIVRITLPISIVLTWTGA